MKLFRAPGLFFLPILAIPLMSTPDQGWHMSSFLQEPRTASARGGHRKQVDCGKKFGGALLGRGHGRDLDSDSEYGEYPWHVGILASLRRGDSSEYLCGGALIDSEHILTAAHCVKSFYPEELHIRCDLKFWKRKTISNFCRLGDWDVNSNMEPYAHMEFAVDSIFIHEMFFSAR